MGADAGIRRGMLARPHVVLLVVAAAVMACDAGRTIGNPSGTGGALGAPGGQGGLPNQGGTDGGVGGGPGGGSAGQGGEAAYGGGGVGGAAGGLAGQGGGAAGQGGAVGRTSCATDSDCVFQPADGCCGACLAVGAAPTPAGQVCIGACLAPPGGCSCVDHVCARGVLGSRDPCDPAQDACGSGLKCCALCGPLTAPVQSRLVESCEMPACAASLMNSDGPPVCPQLI